MRVRERMMVVAEDPCLLRLLLETVSLQLPYVHAETHRSTASVVHRLRQCSASVVLTDLSMPIGSGFAVVTGTARCSPQTPVIALVSSGERESAEQALSEGAFDVIWKPVARRELLDSVRSALATYRLRQRLTSAEQSVQRLQGLLHAAHERALEVGSLQREQFERVKWAATQSCVLSQQVVELIRRRLQHREEVLKKHQIELDARLLAAHRRAVSRLQEVS